MTLAIDGALESAARTLFSAPSDADRRAALATLAAAGPAVRIPLPGGQLGWLVTDHAAVRRLLAHPNVRKQRDLFAGPFAHDLPPGVGDGLFRHMLNANPPDHGRLRRLVAAAFTRRRVDATAPRIQQLTDGLLDSAASQDGPVDLIDALAAPLPVRVIGDLLGVPEADFPRFRAWTRPLVTGVLAGRDTYVEAAVGMLELLRDLVARRRATPGDDLLSGLVEARDAGDRLDEDELTSAGFLLLAAGHETTVNLIGNGVLELVRHPDQLQKLREQPDLIDSAIDEMLRFTNPVGLVAPRYAREDLEVAGVPMPKGTMVTLLIGSANLDETVFPDADRLDITRSPNRHLSFGHGAHYCLGAPLARLETSIAIPALLQRFERLELTVPAEKLRWSPHIGLRGVDVLPLLVTPTGSAVGRSAH